MRKLFIPAFILSLSFRSVADYAPSVRSMVKIQTNCARIFRDEGILKSKAIGDLDGDKFITAIDLVLIEKHVLGNDYFDYRADLNGDAKVDMADVVLVRLISAGNIVGLSNESMRVPLNCNSRSTISPLISTTK